MLIENSNDPVLVFEPKIETHAVTRLTSEFQDFIDEAGPMDNQDQGTDMERLVEAAGRECYASYGVGRSSEDFHEHIQEVQHFSVMEHVQFTFRISGVSRSLTHEHVRHRIGVAISQRSQRYVDESNCKFVVPPRYIIRNSDSEEIAVAKLGAQRLCAKNHRDSIADYNMLLKLDEQIGGKKNRKAARGAARNVLGAGTETSLLWSGNVRALLEYLKKRGNRGADQEIRRLAVRLYLAANKYAPQLLQSVEQYVDPEDGIWSLRVGKDESEAARLRKEIQLLLKKLKK